MVTVPSQYQAQIQSDATATGMPYSVVANQVNDESSFNPNAVSSAGAEGMYQFLPSTYNALASQAGVPENTEYNTADEAKVYDLYMQQLLTQEGGSIFKALEAYNAGPADLNAGSSYATNIESQAGVKQSAVANKNATTTADVQTDSWWNPLSWASDADNALDQGIAEGGEDILKGVTSSIFGALGVTSLKDLLQRAGIMLLGLVLLIVGIRALTSGNSSSPINITTTSDTDESGSTTKSTKVKHPFGSSTTKTTSSSGQSLGISKAMDSAAVA